MDALASIDSVRRKIESGEYATENVPCPCGAEYQDTALTETDRYGIPYRTVVCEECGLIRANPRPTAETYHKFYNTEYRTIHFWQGAEKHQVEAGKLILEFMDSRMMPRPKTVVDFGCHAGGTLLPFKEDGATVYGIEWDENALAKLSEKGIVSTRTIDEMIALGVKADLVIMQDSIEHLTDLNDVVRLSKLLNENGQIYVWTPGFFTTAEGRWQLAHTFQFCAATLEYVMSKMGFTATYINEDVLSFWKYTGAETEEVEKPQEWVEYTLDEVYGNTKRKLPPFRTKLKFTVKELYDNADKNMSHGIPDLSEYPQQSGEVAIVSGGPSVDDHVEELRALYNRGVPVMAIGKMNPWLVKQGIIPTYVVALDCMEDQERGFDVIDEKTIFLLGTVTRPSIVEKVKHLRCYLWDSRMDEDFADLRRKHGYKKAMLINTGCSVSVACHALAMTMGFRDLHVFGADCMASLDKVYADGIVGVQGDADLMPCVVDGSDEVFYTSAVFMEYAREIINFIASGREEGILNSIKYYGDSLVTRMWDGKWEDDDVVQS